MSVADIVLIIGGLSGILSLAITAWRERNKPTVDMSESERIEAEAGKLRAETEKMRQDLISQMTAATAQQNREIEALRRNVNLVLTWAREFYDGAQRNAKYIREVHNEEPPYSPPPKFPTGPLAAIEAKS